LITIRDIREKLTNAQPIAKILILDIETGMMQFQFNGYSRKLYSQFLKPDYIKSAIWIPCAAWKWIGQNTLGSVSVLHDKQRFERDFRDDYHVVKVLHELLTQADIVVGHNIDKFDMRQIRKRCVYHNFSPLKPIQTVDTLKLARQIGDFEANDLRYIARFLNIAQKGDSPDWELIAAGDIEELKKCIQYNKQDIRVTEQVYLRLRPWAKARPNQGVFQAGVHHTTCPVCGGSHIQPDEPFYTSTQKYNGYRCVDCKTYIKGKKSIKTTEVK
jgi:hypothetical protein